MDGRDNSWDGILEPGEDILWQGQPDGGFRLIWFDIVPGAFGGLFALFSLFWMVMAGQAGGLFWMVGLIHFSVGIGLMVGRPVASWWMRRHSFYSLSNRRAFIASDYPFKGRVLKSWPITAESTISLSEGKTDTVLFATERRRRHKGGSYTVKIGFEGIHEGRKVLALLHAIQREHRHQEGQSE